MTNATAIATTMSWRAFTTSLVPLGVVPTEKIDYFLSFYQLYQKQFSCGGRNGKNLGITLRSHSRDTVTTKFLEVAAVFLGCTSGATFKYVHHPVNWTT